MKDITMFKFEDLTNLEGAQPPKIENGVLAFKKDEKLNLMHIAICRLLEPYGFYEFDFVDKDGWPHYTIKEELPPLKAGEQSVLMKEAIVNYFLEREVIE